MAGIVCCDGISSVLLCVVIYCQRHCVVTTFYIKFICQYSSYLAAAAAVNDIYLQWLK